ncbi:MAG: type II secretion system protein GspN [Myxococcales bacterium]|nr:type II secretion system protein GspN [Myxococcales bacterium]
MDRIPIKQILQWTGYPLFFVLCFLFFAYKTFPYERLADRIVQEASVRGYEIEILDLTHSGLAGLTFEGLRWVVPSEEEGSPPLDLIFDELTVSTSLFSLMSKTKSYSFDAELAGGDADGDVTIGENDLDVDIEIDEVDLGALPALRQFTKVPLGGTLSGEIVLVMPSEIAESTGNIAVTIEALSIGDGKSKLEIPDWGGLTLDRAEAGNLDLTVTIEEGLAKIERATARGKDLELDALGRVRLLRPLKRADLNVMVRAKIQNAYKERSAKVATMLELASSGLKAAQTTDGAIQYTIAGAIGGRLRPRAAGNQTFQAPK